MNIEKYTKSKAKQKKKRLKTVQDAIPIQKVYKDGIFLAGGLYTKMWSFYINEDYLSYLPESYDDTYYSERLLNAGSALYVERNADMIDKSNVCIFYYDENYLPPRRRNAKRDIADYQPKSGTKIAYD